jgi:hypothetical protein
MAARDNKADVNTTRVVDQNMRFDLRLHGRTGEGQRCVADVSVYADSHAELQKQVEVAGTGGPWYTADEACALIPDESTITVERVELLNKPTKRSSG